MSNFPKHLEDPIAEKGLIGCILQDPELLDKLLGKTEKPLLLFTNHSCTKLMIAMLKLNESSKAVDRVTLAHELLKATGETDTIAFMDECENLTPSPLNWEYYLGILTELLRTRETKILCDEVSRKIANDAVTEPTGVLEELFESVEGLCRVKDKETSVRAYKDVAPETVEFFQTCFENKGKITGITTGLSSLDKMINGVNNRHLNIVAARPSVGKTSLGICMADAAALAGKKVLFFSLEMSASEIMMRSICSHMELNYRDCLDGSLSSEELKKIALGIDHVSKYPIFIDDSSSSTIHQIKTKSKRYKRDFGIDMIVVDYLQIISTNKKHETRDREIASYSSALKELARELNVPVVCLSQLSREGARNERKPRLTDLRDSGAIEQDADVVIMIHRDNTVDNQMDRPYPLHLIVAKQRNGPVGEVEVEFMPAYTKLRTPSLMNYPDAVSTDSFGNPLK
jgi:replicative DNA helicase